MKKDKLVILLKKLQLELQQKFKKKITAQRTLYYDFRGVWIVVHCACGHEFRTPYFIPDNAKCPECKKLFYRAVRGNYNLDYDKRVNGHGTTNTNINTGRKDQINTKIME